MCVCGFYTVPVTALGGLSPLEHTLYKLLHVLSVADALVQVGEVTRLPHETPVLLTLHVLQNKAAYQCRVHEGNRKPG